MIYFFTPYSFNLKLLDAIASCMNLLQTDDWAVLMDGDAMFLQPDFGHQIQRHIEANPDAGLFTCYASRCHYSIQVPPGVDMENDSIRYHKLVSNNLSINSAGKVKEINRHVAGHLMVIRKSTWSRILPTVQRTAADKKVLGVDTKISKAVLAAGLKILLMEDMYLLHYCRLQEGFDYTDHLTSLVFKKGL
jgi:GT2 family glycosyltransferase